jgi:hypothetical protein
MHGVHCLQKKLELSFCIFLLVLAWQDTPFLAFKKMENESFSTKRRNAHWQCWFPWYKLCLDQISILYYEKWFVNGHELGYLVFPYNFIRGMPFCKPRFCKIYQNKDLDFCVPCSSPKNESMQKSTFLNFLKKFFDFFRNDCRHNFHGKPLFFFI